MGRRSPDRDISLESETGFLLGTDRDQTSAAVLPIRTRARFRRPLGQPVPAGFRSLAEPVFPELEAVRNKKSGIQSKSGFHVCPVLPNPHRLFFPEKGSHSNTAILRGTAESSYGQSGPPKQKSSVPRQIRSPIPCTMTGPSTRPPLRREQSQRKGSRFMKKQKSTWVKMYFSWIPHLERLSPEECGALFLALLKYGETGEILELPDKADILFYVFREILDRDRQQSIRNSRNGAKSGRPPKTAPDAGECRPEPAPSDANSAFPDRTEGDSVEDRGENPPISPELAVRESPPQNSQECKDTISDGLADWFRRNEGCPAAPVPRGWRSDVQAWTAGGSRSVPERQEQQPFRRIPEQFQLLRTDPAERDQTADGGFRQQYPARLTLTRSLESKFKPAWPCTKRRHPIPGSTGPPSVFSRKSG